VYELAVGEERKEPSVITIHQRKMRKEGAISPKKKRGRAAGAGVVGEASVGRSEKKNQGYTTFFKGKKEGKR